MYINPNDVPGMGVWWTISGRGNIRQSTQFRFRSVQTFDHPRFWAGGFTSKEAQAKLQASITASSQKAAEQASEAARQSAQKNCVRQGRCSCSNVNLTSRVVFIKSTSKPVVSTTETHVIYDAVFAPITGSTPKGTIIHWYQDWTHEFDVFAHAYGDCLPNAFAIGPR